MSKLQFTPTDFALDMAVSSDAVQSAKIAQDKFEKWLSEQPLVYGDHNSWEWREKPKYASDYIAVSGNFKESKFSARLIDIQELKKSECPHHIVRSTQGQLGICDACNANLKTKGWERV